MFLSDRAGIYLSVIKLRRKTLTKINELFQHECFRGKTLSGTKVAICRKSSQVTFEVETFLENISVGTALENEAKYHS